MSNQQKANILKILNGLLTTGKTAQIRDAINKFRLNRRITEIQRNFLKRLLMSKAGLVVIAFRKMQSLPNRINNDAYKKASKFEKGLSSFVERTVKRALGAFKNEYEEGQASKKRAVIQLIECTMGGQKKLYNRWLTIQKNYTLYQRCLNLQIFFENNFRALNRNYSPIFLKKQFSFQKINILHRYFSKVQSNTTQNLKTSLIILQKNACQERVNPWFKKAAQVLALNTKINVQKSFWRLKYNMHTSGVMFNAALIVKLKKMYNNIRKYYELNMFRAFLMIDKYGRAVQDISVSASRNTSDFIKQHHVFRQQDSSIMSSQYYQGTDLNLSRMDNANNTAKRVSIGVMERIFNKNVLKHLKQWEYVTHPQKKFIEYYSQVKNSNQNEKYIQFSKFGALQKVFCLLQKAKIKIMLKSFQQLRHYNQFNNQNQYGKTIQQRLQLINRQSILIQQIRNYKSENQGLLEQIQKKNRYLKDANQSVTLLSLRINYMITQKFMNLVEKVTDGIQFRNLNIAFDLIIQRANDNYEKEEIEGQYIE